MKELFRLTILFCGCAGLPLGALGGPEPLSGGKEMKQVAPAPAPECNWTGLYVGLHVGGQFGHSEDQDLDDYNSKGQVWGYSESGVVAGGQVGYNWQWRWLVLGPEFDLGYMNLDGSGVQPFSVHFDNSDTVAHTDSDFYATFRGRIGVAFNSWLFYATGGGIGVNWDTRVLDDCNTGGCGSRTTDAHEQDFDWGWTVGGGIERMIGCHWSIKTEYLYYTLDDQTFSGASDVFGTPNRRFSWEAHGQGHIIRAGLNYKF